MARHGSWTMDQPAGPTRSAVVGPQRETPETPVVTGPPRAVSPPSQTGATAAGRTGRGRSATWVRTLACVVIGLAVAEGVGLRAWFLFHQPITSDEAVAGLIAHQILHGHTYAFFWGQPFGGVEPYAVAAVFAVAGQSGFTLGMTPVLLSIVSSLLVWRVARRLVASGAVAALAGALAWAAPLPVVFTTTQEGGYRGATLVCGLMVLLFSLRILDGKGGVGEFVALGLAAGVGWWALPEIVYFLIPSVLILVGAIVKGWPEVGTVRWIERAAVSLGAFAVGGLPWIWTNIGSGFASLDSSKFPGAITPLNPGYSGRLRIFFRSSLPMYLDLRRLSSGAVLFGTSGAGRAGLALLAVAFGCVVLGALFLCFFQRGRCTALGAAVVVMPLIVALQPGTWYWEDGRYTVYLGPLLALVVAVGFDQAARRFARRQPGDDSAENSESNGRAREGSPRLAAIGMSVVVAVCVVATVVDFHQSFAVGPRAFVSSWGNPDGAATATAAALEHRGIVDGYADYWVAYKLDFLSRERLSLTVAGSDPDRWTSLTRTVERAPHAAWLFVTPALLPDGFSQFAPTQAIQGPSGLPEASFLSDLSRLGIGWRMVQVGPIDAVVPDRAVILTGRGQVEGAPD